MTFIKHSLNIETRQPACYSALFASPFHFPALLFGNLLSLSLVLLVICLNLNFPPLLESVKKGQEHSSWAYMELNSRAKYAFQQIPLHPSSSVISQPSLHFSQSLGDSPEQLSAQDSWHAVKINNSLLSSASCLRKPRKSLSN